jgi:hypothetical protein
MKIPSKEEKMRLHNHPGLFAVALLAGISLLVSGCGQTSGDDTGEDTPLFMALSFNEPILVGDLEDNAADAYLQTSPEGEVFLSWTDRDPEAEGHNNGNAFVARVNPDGQQLDDTRHGLFPVLVADDSHLYVSWTERKGETSQVKLQTIDLATIQLASN